MRRRLIICLSVFAVAQAWVPIAPRPLARSRSTSWSSGRLFPDANHHHRKKTNFCPTTMEQDGGTTTATRSVATSSPQPEQLYDANMIYPEREVTVTRLVNGILLAACFGYALYTILNIDHGMTRGWTAAEIARRVPLDNWSSYESALLEKPVMTKTVINVIIYLLGDWLSQTAFQKKNVLDFDVGRTLRNGFIGLCFGPLVHQYYEFSDHILPVEGGLINRAEKILMDQTLYLTIKCSIYISAVSLLNGEGWETAQQTVKDRIGPVVFTAWKFWPLVHCITYGLIPARHRILWVNCVDLVWNAILASKAREPEEPSDGGMSSEEEGGEDDSFFSKIMSPLAVEDTVGHETVDVVSNGSTLPDRESTEVHGLDVPESSVMHMDSSSFTNSTAFQGEPVAVP